MKILKNTPIMIVKSIENALPFWEGLGFNIAVKVPEKGNMLFAILTSNEKEVMLQSFESINDDLNFKDKIKIGDIIQYIDVDSIEKVQSYIKKINAEIIVGLRKTFYGTNEIYIKTHDGLIVGFAEVIK